MVPPYVWSDGPPLPYKEQVSYGPSPHVQYDFSGLLQKSPLCVLIICTLKIKDSKNRINGK